MSGTDSLHVPYVGTLCMFYVGKDTVVAPAFIGVTFGVDVVAVSSCCECFVSWRQQLLRPLLLVMLRLLTSQHARFLALRIVPSTIGTFVSGVYYRALALCVDRQSWINLSPM